ncbi:hypothetical protein ACFL48_03355 [Pseudomonadota bacterium]
MSICSTNHNDPRVTCGILAQSILHNIEDASAYDHSEKNTLLLNIFRLMQTYQYDVRPSNNRLGVLETKTTHESLTADNSYDLFDAVKSAIDNALESAFPELDSSQSIQKINQCLHEMAEDRLDDIDQPKVKIFFEVLQRNVTEG